MAKLNVVIPAVEVTVDGVTYRKVDRKAQAGDIVRITGTGYFEVETNAYYLIVDGAKYGRPGIYSIVDDGGTFRWAQLSEGDDWEVYAPISDSSPGTITFQGATWRKVDRDVRAGDAIKFTDDDRGTWLTGSELYVVNRLDSCDDPQIMDDDGDEYDARGEDYEVYEKVADSAAGSSAPTYREVKRKAAVGERIKITNRVRREDRYSDDAEFIVKNADSDGDVYVDTEGQEGVTVLSSEYVVLEPVTESAEPTEPTQPERLKVGEYARFVIDGATVMRTGDIVEITEVDSTVIPYRTKRLIDGKEAWTPEEKLVRATDEEVAAAKRAALIAQFSVGDSVRLTVEDGKRPRFGYGNVSNGDVGKVSSTLSDRIIVDFPTRIRWMADASELTKLTAEEVAEIERKQAEEKRWAAIGRKVNEYKRGDIVLCVGKAKAGLGEVQSDANGSRVSVKYYSSFGTCSETFNIIALVSPVEQRFDRSAEEVDAA